MVLAASAAACLTDTYLAEPNCKNPPKIQLRKLVKLTGHTYAYNNLTSFWMWSATNHQKRKWLPSAETWVEEKIVKSHQVTSCIILWPILPIWNHCATRARAWTRCATMTWSVCLMVRNISRNSTLHPGYKWLRTRTTAHWTEPFDGIISLADLDYLDWVALTQIFVLVSFWFFGSNPKI